LAFLRWDFQNLRAKTTAGSASNPPQPPKSRPPASVGPKYSTHWPSAALILTLRPLHPSLPQQSENPTLSPYIFSYGRSFPPERIVSRLSLVIRARNVVGDVIPSPFRLAERTVRKVSDAHSRKMLSLFVQLVVRANVRPFAGMPFAPFGQQAPVAIPSGGARIISSPGAGRASHSASFPHPRPSRCSKSRRLTGGFYPKFRP
jgi:hypothetical protein